MSYLGKTTWTENGDKKPVTKIIVNKDITNNEDILRQTLAHEIIHHHLYQTYGNKVSKHGEHFGMFADRINAKEGENFVSQYADHTNFKPNGDDKVEADFKSIKQKFKSQGIEDEAIDSYIEMFRSIKDRNKIKDSDERNIDNWTDWTEFRSFVDRMKLEKSGAEEKKEIKQGGAELVAENNEWKVLKIKSFDACQLYGSSSMWCITEQSKWDAYTKEGDFFFIISKTRKRSDPWHKIAMLKYSEGSSKFWDAVDNVYNELPNYLHVPNF